MNPLIDKYILYVETVRRYSQRTRDIYRDVLTEYWRDYDCTLDYYMFHDFFYEIAKLFPEEIAAMPRKNRLLPLMLLERNGVIPDEEWFEELKKRCCFHKLNYRLANM